MRESAGLTPGFYSLASCVPVVASADASSPLDYFFHRPLTSEDRIHGFKMPDFGLRTDIVPGQETRVTITPDKEGDFTYFCDVFWGGGHEDMNGTLVVEA